MFSIALVLMAMPVGLLAYSYLAYPALLWGLRSLRKHQGRLPEPTLWPTVTLIIPCHNEARTIGATIESALGIDYPAGRCQILVISDASSDGTDSVVATYAEHGVELLRLARRAGKTAAENAAVTRIRGEIVVITDATARMAPGAIRELVTAFQDPTVGVASGRDVSVGDLRAGQANGEAGYVGYEMWVRSLETHLGTIVGASGCLFASRRHLFDTAFPEALSRDFASCLIAREHGYRSVSIEAAQVLVPRAGSLQAEYRRKSRTMARGLGTLWHKRGLLNPLKFGAFAFMLFSHKLCRWLVQLTLPMLAAGAVLLAFARPSSAPWLISIGAGVVGVAVLSWWWPASRPLPRVISPLAYLLWSNIAGMAAWLQFFRGRRQPYWDPTRRPEPRSAN